jgi:hypothetical protein
MARSSIFGFTQTVSSCDLSCATVSYFGRSLTCYVGSIESLLNFEVDERLEVSVQVLEYRHILSTPSSMQKFMLNYLIYTDGSVLRKRDNIWGDFELGLTIEIVCKVGLLIFRGPNLPSASFPYNTKAGTERPQTARRSTFTVVTTCSDPCTQVSEAKLTLYVALLHFLDSYTPLLASTSTSQTAV